jgi:hypothetical protein
MTITYSVDGGSEIHGVQSSWKRIPIRTDSDGTITHSRWAINTWEIPIIGLTNFETLRAAQGTSLTSVETNDINNINDGKTYPRAFLEGVVNGGHLAIQMHSVKLTFRIDIKPIWKVVGIPRTHPSRKFHQRRREQPTRRNINRRRRVLPSR